ncbi:MAG: xanthine dehydrogenase FAD-binding subunit XdhB [Clostridium sp.]|uniref:xanthine dehydrogenase FAD-binding subunit XdhB n=1 Tax=Clostridium TaxID=1485 RepID=UPI002153647D|nr:xanthine dehydrogenase FAD-binding subunit XdhB [Clostridium sp. LY3-2]MCR6514560.1 xanthine dehydrogenase FAD-binding subunit XdhB [Clostridium sp. LY3-2]
MYDITGILEPNSLDQALELLNNVKDLTIIAGGTDVLVKLREERFKSLCLLSLRDIESLKKIDINPDGSIEIGSMTTFTEIFRSDIINKYIPTLAEAAVSLGGPQIRNIATIGGNVCNGAVSADSAPTLFAYNANLKLKSRNTERIVPIKDFYRGPGIVNISKDEILVSIIINKEDYFNKFGKYEKFASRNALDIALMGVSVVLEIEDDKFKDLRIGLGVSGPTPLRCETSENLARGMEITDENMKLLGETALKSSHAIDFWNASKEYKEHLIEVLSYRCIEKAVDRARGKDYEL